MGILQKDHVLGAGTAALIGAVVGAALGWFIAGIPGMVLGAVGLGALAAVLGNRASEAVDPRDDLGRFEQIYHSMPYYISDMGWDDYAPAYRYGIAHYHKHDAQPFADQEVELERGWASARGESRLTWGQAREAVAHVWRWYDEELHHAPHVPQG